MITSDARCLNSIAENLPIPHIELEQIEALGTKKIAPLRHTSTTNLAHYDSKSIASSCRYVKIRL